VIAPIAVGTPFAMNKMPMSNIVRLLIALIGPILGARGMNRQVDDWHKAIREAANDNDSGARIVNSRR
jgi:hypothetical protein